MVKNIFLGLAIALGSGLTASADTIVLTPSTLTPGVGSLFTINLSVTGNTDELLGFGFNQSISTAAFLLQTISINPFFGPDLGLGNPQVSAFTFPGSTASTVNLVMFTFLAQQVGSGIFTVAADLTDPNQGLFFLNDPAGALDGYVTINVQPVPEPALGGLVALALLGVLSVARFRRQQKVAASRE